MKFHKIASFFKRSQSDSAISTHLESVVAPAKRPHSLSAIDDIVLPLDASNPFASQLLAAGTLAKTPSVDLSTTNLASTESISAKGSGSNVSCASSGHISTASHTVVVEVLTRRIQELEEQRIGAEWHATLDGGGSAESAKGTCGKLQQQNRQLSTELSDVRMSLSRTIQQLSAVQTKNDRLQALFDLPILVSVFQAVLSGATPLEALINSVKQAISQSSLPGSSGNPWRTLLEPVVGSRSPEDYIAQVNCTLRARRESRDWRKKALFWKGHAREDGRHQDTVTPSSSQLSDIVEHGACAPKPSRAEETSCTYVKLPVNYISVETRAEVHDPSSPVAVQVPIVPPTESTSELYATRAQTQCSPPSGGDHVATAETVNPRMVLDEPHRPVSKRSLSSCDTALGLQSGASSSSMYENLPPLASVTFRESYSIRSISSKKDNGPLSSSTSKSSVPRKSRISAQNSSVDVASLREPDPSMAPSRSIAESSSLSQSVLEPISESHAEPEVERAHTPLPLPAPTAADEAGSKSRPGSSEFSFGSGSWEHLSVFLTKSFSFFAGDSGPATVATAAKVSDVFTIAQAEPKASQPAQATTNPMTKVDNVDENAKPGAPISTPSSTPRSSPNSSPMKKSRLPVMRKTKPTVQSATAKFIKRLSRNISKPLLMESTNVAVIDSRTQPSKVPMGRSIAGSSANPASGFNKSKMASSVVGSAGVKNQKGKTVVSPAKKVVKGTTRA